jgi:uncharacterized protein YbjT (DUF2867 family)
MIVITAPTGDIGSQLLEQVLGSDEPVRVIVRDPARLSPEARERADIVVGSHGDLDVVSRAFEGADSVFWLVPPDPRAGSLEAVYLDFTRPACKAFTTQGVSRVVAVSALGRGWPGDAGHITASLAMDDLIAGTGVHFRALTMPSFMEGMLRQVPAIRERGMFFSPIAGDLRLPSVATRDIAAVAAGLLLDHSWTGQEDVPVLGPEDLSSNDMAQIMTEVLGKPVRFQQVGMEAFRETLTGFGMSEAIADGMVAMMTAKNEGIDTIVPRTARSTTPTTFRQWCEEVLRPAVLA